MKHARLWALQLIVTILVLVSPALGQTSWWRAYGGTDDAEGSSVQQTKDGGYVVSGCTDALGYIDVYLIKTNTSGDTLWTRIYGGEDEDEGTSVQQTSDSGYVITGLTVSIDVGDGDVYIIKTNVSGETLWTRTYGGTDYDIGWSVQQTSDGGYIIGGWTSSFSPYNSYTCVSICLSVAAMVRWMDSCSCGVLALGNCLCSFSILSTKTSYSWPASVDHRYAESIMVRHVHTVMGFIVGHGPWMTANRVLAEISIR